MRFIRGLRCTPDQILQVQIEKTERFLGGCNKYKLHPNLKSQAGLKLGGPPRLAKASGIEPDLFQTSEYGNMGANWTNNAPCETSVSSIESCQLAPTLCLVTTQFWTSNISNHSSLASAASELGQCPETAVI